MSDLSGYFRDLYAADADPWGFQSRWYEERKRAITLAALPSPRYGRALELGCSIGVLTAQLAPRCDALLATDFDPTALGQARARLADASNVEFAHSALPDEWPDGQFDLILMSEVGYFLTEEALRQRRRADYRIHSLRAVCCCSAIGGRPSTPRPSMATGCTGSSARRRATRPSSTTRRTTSCSTC